MTPTTPACPGSREKWSPRPGLVRASWRRRVLVMAGSCVILLSSRLQWPSYRS